MRFFTRLLFSLLFVVSLHILFIHAAKAEGEFSTDYKVSYVVDENGKTSVTQYIVLKNNTANYYAESFELKIGSTKVENVKASDDVGPMAADVKFENNLTTIAVKFNQKVIGINKTLPWTLTYSSNELASKTGQIWDISIPRLSKSDEIASYSAEVSVPAAFGPVNSNEPQPKTESKQGIYQVFTFDRDQLFESGISISFGEKQVFEFTLNYYLENNNLTKRMEEITLPPDNNYQKVVYKSIEPTPLDVSVDEDGNFMAKYEIGPKQSQRIVIQGHVEVFSKPFRNINRPLSPEEKKTYVASQPYWEVDAAAIKQKAQELKTPHEIYKFVSDYLSYSEERLNKGKIERKGALAAFNNPNDSVCMEFTDLFIAMSRAAGIPAREVIGYAYTQNTRLRPLSFVSEGDLLHAWPEYWDDNLGWVQVDPTWGSTSGGLDYFNKLDFNHITLTHRGLSSISPYSAGSYKKAGEENKKDVIVAFAQELPNITIHPEIELVASKKLIAGFPANAKGKIRNAGSSSIIGGNLALKSNYLEVTPKDPVSFYILPPFSQEEVDYTLQSKGFFTKINETLVLSFNDVEITKLITVLPIYYIFVSKFFVASVFIAAIIIAAGSIIYDRIWKKKLASKPRLK